MKNYLLLIPLLLITSKTNTVNNCDCTGENEWKNERVVVAAELDEQNPYNSIINIHVKRWYNSGFYSTASFINNSTIITAHHNLLRRSHIKRITYTINGETVELKRRDFEIHYYQRKYRTNSDIAIIKITNLNKIKEVQTNMKISVDILNNTDSNVHLTGFPCDSEDDNMIDKQASASSLKLDSSAKLIGYPLYTCTGDSGAPLWVMHDNSHYLIGIHHGGNEGNQEFHNISYNISTYLNKDVINWINSVK